MQKCCDVEKECLSYGRALGAHAKATGSSVGEIRKELVLPKRYEAICEFQERLRQVSYFQYDGLVWSTYRVYPPPIKFCIWYEEQILGVGI